MEWAYNLSGGSPVMLNFIVDQGATVSSGAPVEANGNVANGDGVIEPTTGDAVADAMIGVAVDAATTTAAQVGGGADNAGFVKVTVNPDAVYRIKISGGAAEDTTLAIITASQAASSDGLTITSATDEFTVWGFTGANAGFIRRCDASASVLTAMPFPIAANDQFVQSNHALLDYTQWIDLSTNLTQFAVASAVDSDNDNFYLVNHELRDQSDDGLTNSFIFGKIARHAFGNTGAGL